jgi:hypothetical protein
MCDIETYVPYWVRVMVFNATFNYISAISWWSVLLVEEIGEKTTTFRKSLTTLSQ